MCHKEKPVISYLYGSAYRSVSPEKTTFKPLCKVWYTVGGIPHFLPFKTEPYTV